MAKRGSSPPVQDVDCISEDLHPRRSFDLIGHDGALQVAARQIRSGRPPQALLIAGPPGIGKATLAYRIARYLLAHGASDAGAEDLSLPPRDAAALQIAAGAHPGLLVLKRRIDPDSGRMMSVLPVKEIRRLGSFFGMTAAGGGYRVALIDTADDMNESAANALLKQLEEPPRRAMLLILAHAPGSALPTVRSRCQLLSLRPLSDADMRKALAPHLTDASPADIDMLIRLGGGAPGAALRLYHSDGLELAGEAERLIEQAEAPDIAALIGLAGKLARIEDGLPRFGDFLSQILTMRLRDRALASRDGLRAWTEALQSVTGLRAKAQGLHLDPNQTILAMAEAARQAARRAGPL